MSMLGVLRATEQARTATGRAGARPRARAPEWAAALLALALSLAMPLLSGCGPQGGADSRDAAASATGVQDRALQAELEQQERIASAHPREHLRELQAIESRAAPGSAERLEALSQRAALLAQLRDRSGHEAAVEALKAWPESSPVRAQIPLALMLARAQWLKANGELGAGVRLLGGLADMDAAQADRRMLWRATELRAYMQGDYGEVDAAVESGLKALEQARAMGSRWRAATNDATLAFNYFRSQQFDHALRAAREALETAQQDPDPVLMYSVYTILGIVHSQDEDPRLSQQAREQIGRAHV